ncbi:helix-turn-helix domain-containing protein [Paraburkholderia hayleyella]|uniref:helix-turn-helix domain-containing protein n=1 Tax=Paraburkholderia hayleyella TaxID=2152889 RepID=UPI001C655501|nr:helix-turn-helix transcriptional regulator [Paraburkholderia hayleyella]
MASMARNTKYEHFQGALIEARQKNNLTQQEVASRIGKPQSYVSKYESGERRLDVVEFLDVCKALGVKPISILKRLDTDDQEEIYP